MYISNAMRQAYSELDEFIELLDEYYKKKIPPKLREFFKNEKDVSYVKNINSDIPIKEQNLKKETLALIAMLNLKYWCEDEDEKKRLNKIYNQNEAQYQEELRKKYNSNTLFNNKKMSEVQDTEENKKTMALVEIQEEKWYKKIFNSIKGLFKR